MTKKLGIYAKALRAAAKELNLPKDDWTVEKLATLNVMLAVARHKWEGGQTSSAANDMVVLMGEITALRKEAKAKEDINVRVNFVKRFIGIATCDKCGHKFEVSDQPFDDDAPLIRQRAYGPRERDCGAV